MFLKFGVEVYSPLNVTDLSSKPMKLLTDISDSCSGMNSLYHWKCFNVVFVQLGGRDLDDPDLPFFFSPEGEPASVSKTTFQLFAAAVSLPNASFNTVRKSATTVIRSDPEQKTKEPQIMDHSAGVAERNYDQSRTKTQVSHLLLGEVCKS